MATLTKKWLLNELNKAILILREYYEEDYLFVEHDKNKVEALDKKTRKFLKGHMYEDK